MYAYVYIHVYMNMHTYISMCIHIYITVVDAMVCHPVPTFRTKALSPQLLGVLPADSLKFNLSPQIALS